MARGFVREAFHPEDTQVNILDGLPSVIKRRFLEFVIEQLIELTNQLDGDADIEDGPHAFNDLEPYLSGFGVGCRLGEWDLEIDAGDEPEIDHDQEIDHGETCEGGNLIEGGQGA